MTQIRKAIEPIGSIFLMLLVPLLEWVGISNDIFAVIAVSLFDMINWDICKFFCDQSVPPPKPF